MSNPSSVLVDVRNLKQYFPITTGFMKTTMLKAVDDVSFSIARGETLGLVGESGCGKTTVGRSLLQLYKPTSGEIWFDGKRIDKSTMAEFHRRAQMVFQDPYSSLNPRMTVGDIVAEPIDVHRLCKGRKERTERVQELLKTVGISSEQATRYAHEFSGGQRQRIGIARALIMEPEFIVADEPISALDVSIRAQVLNLLAQLQKERGLTYLFISHDLSVMRFICDRIAVIHKGLLVELADCEKLFAHPLHPYTRALLSAIPQPDPIKERNKQLEIYDPKMHDYSVDKPEWVEIEDGHFVLGNKKEIAEYREKLNN